MKKALVVLGFVFVVGMGTAEASIGQSLGNLWGYVFAPVNCAAALLTDLVGAGTKFVVCVLANANPKNIVP